MYLTDILWNPIQSVVERDYLRLTYPESSYMEYPEYWKKRMSAWDEATAILAAGLSTSLDRTQDGLEYPRLIVV